jgi:predicted small metal-binding protein
MLSCVGGTRRVGQPASIRLNGLTYPTESGKVEGHTGRDDMAKSLKCADLGMADCPGSFTVETEEELMQHVQMHASVAHPDLEITPETSEQMKAVVKTV